MSIIIYSVESKLSISDISPSIRQVRALCTVLPHLPHRRLPPAPVKEPSRADRTSEIASSYLLCRLHRAR